VPSDWASLSWPGWVSGIKYQLKLSSQKRGK